jgi:hypothetical protein
MPFGAGIYTGCMAMSSGAPGRKTWLAGLSWEGWLVPTWVLYMWLGIWWHGSWICRGTILRGALERLNRPQGQDGSWEDLAKTHPEAKERN